MPHLKTWSDGWIKTSSFFHAPNWLFVIPGLILLFTGFLLFILTIQGTIMINEVLFVHLFYNHERNSSNALFSKLQLVQSFQ